MVYYDLLNYQQFIPPAAGFAPVFAGVLSVTGTTATAVTLAETAITGGTPIYNTQLQRAPDVAGSPGTYANLVGQTSTSSTPTFNDTTVAAATSYWYRALTTDFNGEMAFSNVVKATTPAALPLAAGTLVITHIGTTSVSLAETAITGGLAPYSTQLQQAPDSAGSPGTYANVGGTVAGATPSFVATGLTAATKYWWRAVTTDSNSTQVISAAITATTASSTGGGEGPVEIGPEVVGDNQIGFGITGAGMIGPPSRRRRRP